MRRANRPVGGLPSRTKARMATAKRSAHTLAALGRPATPANKPDRSNLPQK
jgi:hypothetical protein